MITKKHIERVLRINGLDASAPDDDIRSVLMYAKCQNVDDAIAAIRDKNAKGDKDICGLQKPGARCNVLLADERLKPETIKNLLGIDVEVNFADIEQARIHRKNLSFLQIFGIVWWSVAFATVALLGVMWHYQIGIFHPYF